MIFSLGFDVKNPPNVYVVASSLKEALDKFYASNSKLRAGLKNLVSMNDYLKSYADIHTGDNPGLFGYRYNVRITVEDVTSQGNILRKEKEKEVNGTCIADTPEQVLDHYRDLNPMGVWRITGDKDIIIP